MTIKGDMVAALVSKGFSWDLAQLAVGTVLEVANAPDFALRFAKEHHESDADHYWAVISFLQRMT